MAHFYLSDELVEAEIGSSVSVSGSEARHAVSVSRLGVGDRISVGNGAGLVLSGVVVAASPAEFSITVESLTHFPAATPAIWLAQALAKGDRDEQAVQQATELGVDGVIPWAAQRSIVKWEGNKVAKGVQRWAAIVREATKQSVRPWIPEVADLASGAVLAKLAAETRMIVLDPGGESGLGEFEPDGRDIVIVVGPEGGVSPAELSRLTAAGASVWNLGQNVLRTSTAGPAAIAVLNTRLGRW